MAHTEIIHRFNEGRPPTKIEGSPTISFVLNDGSEIRAYLNRAGDGVLIRNIGKSLGQALQILPEASNTVTVKPTNDEP